MLKIHRNVSTRVMVLWDTNKLHDAFVVFYTFLFTKLAELNTNKRIVYSIIRVNKYNIQDACAAGKGFLPRFVVSVSKNTVGR